MDTQDGIDVDSLAVGLTRPTTILGVPYGAVMLNILVSVETLAMTNNLLWLMISLPVHAICYLITLNDPRTFELLALYIKTSFATLLVTRWYWSASSYSPLTFRTRTGLLKRWRIRRRLQRETGA
jgi:type IV secretion system protein VirB3